MNKTTEVLLARIEKLEAANKLAEEALDIAANKPMWDGKKTRSALAAIREELSDHSGDDYENMTDDELADLQFTRAIAREALAQPVKQEPMAYTNKEQVNELIKESARLIGSIKDEGDQYLTAIDALRNAYRIGLKDSPVDAKAIRAEALEEAAKVADRHSTCLNDTPNVIAAAIRGLK